MLAVGMGVKIEAGKRGRTVHKSPHICCFKNILTGWSYDCPPHTENVLERCTTLSGHSKM